LLTTKDKKTNYSATQRSGFYSPISTQNLKNFTGAMKRNSEFTNKLIDPFSKRKVTSPFSNHNILTKNSYSIDNDRVKTLESCRNATKDSTNEFNHCLLGDNNESLDLKKVYNFKKHAKEQVSERNIVMGEKKLLSQERQNTDFSINNNPYIYNNKSQKKFHAS